MVLEQAVGAFVGLAGGHAETYAGAVAALRAPPRGYAEAMHLRRSLNGALAGAAAATVWAAQQPLDKRVFTYPYDDVELLGKLLTRGRAWPAAGVALHAVNGAVFGAAYAQVKPFLPGPSLVGGVLAGQVENLATWPLGRLVDRYHPAAKEIAPLRGTRALAQAAWRHLVFGLVLAELERRLNERGEEEPPEVPVSSNGHGDLEAALATA